MGINPPDSTYSDLPGTATQTPVQDELEARRTFPPSQQPFPRIPSIPTPKAQPKATGGGGGLNMDMLMPLLLMAAPFLEAHQPGYGMGLVHGVLQHQDEVARQRQNEILTFAKEFANTPDEHWPAVAALLKAHGVADDRIATIKASRVAFQGPDYAVNQQVQKMRDFYAPEVAQHAFTGVPMEQLITPERAAAAQGAGINAYEVRGAVPGQPAGGELGTRTPPVAAVPGHVVARGATLTPTYGELFQEAAGTLFANAPIPMKNGLPDRIEAAKNMQELHIIPTPVDVEAHKERYQNYLRGKLEDVLRNPGSHDLTTLKQQMQAPDAGMNFNVELMKARDIAEKTELARPVFVNIGGQMMPVSRDKAATIAEQQAGKVMVPVEGTMVSMTGKEFADYRLAQKRLAGEESRQAPIYTLSGVKIRNESDYKTAVLLHLLPMPTDPTARRLLLGTDPGAIDQRQAQTELRKVQTQIAYYQPMRGLYAPNIRAAMDAFINGADPKVLEPAIALLQRDQTKVGPNQLRAIDMATMLVGLTKQAQEWQRWATPQMVPPGGSPGAGAAGPPVDPAQFAGQTIQGPDGKRWSSNGTAWSEAP